MSTEFHFTVQRLDMQAEGILARLVTLGSLVPRTLRSRDDFKSVEATQRQIEWVQARWRDRLREIRGEDFANNPAKYARIVFSGNCPPEGAFFLHDHPELRCCHRRFICPWCWARLVAVPFFKKLTDTLDTLGMIGRKSEEKVYPYHLAIRVGTRNVIGPARKALEQAVAWSEGEDLLLQAAGSPGWANFGVVHPIREGFFQIRIGWVALWEKEEPDPIHRLGIRAARLLSGHGRLRKAWILSRLLAFPRGMWYGKPAAAADVLRERGGFRLVRWKGKFFAPESGSEPDPESSVEALDIEDNYQEDADDPSE